MEPDDVQCLRCWDERGKQPSHQDCRKTQLDCAAAVVWGPERAFCSQLSCSGDFLSQAVAVN